MKSSIFILVMIECFAMVAESYHACGLVPPQILEHIRDSPLHDPETQQAANRTLLHLEEIQAQRDQAVGGDGIVSGGDDKVIPDEQTSAGKAALKAEEASLDKADMGKAAPGSVETTLARRATGAERYIYNNDRSCQQKPPVTLVRKPDSAEATDPNVNTVYADFGTIDQFFRTLFGRNSIDNQGGKYHGTVHFCNKYNNAVWDGEQMLFGDGDGKNFKPFIDFIDVAGHEVTHGVIQHSSPLNYQGQSGALNEHIADVFGILVKQYAKKQTAKEADWLLGAGLITGQRAIRDFAHPGTAYNSPGLGKDPQPNSYKDLYKGEEDRGGVHVNSGIPNRAFYLSATAIGGFAYDIPGQVWYNALTSKRLSQDADIPTFAKLTIEFAGKIYNDTIAGYVRKAWTTVDVPLQ